MKKLAVALTLAALTLGPGFAADQKPAAHSSTTSTTKTGKHHRRHHKKRHTTNSGQSGTQAPSK